MQKSFSSAAVRRSFAGGPLLLAVLSGLLLQACGRDPEVTVPPPPIRCYIMAGQSNMAGRGAISAEDTVMEPRLFSMAQNMSWKPAHEPLHFYQPYFAGLDCGHSFGTTLLRQLPEEERVGLIPCAVGDTRITEWLGDSMHIVPLYSNLLERAAAARSEGGEISGILWHQGENDADDSYSSSRYEARLREFIRNCRLDLGNPRLPFFVGLLADFNHQSYKDEVNAAIRRVAATLPDVYLIDTHDLSCKGDSVHFNPEGLREMGRRFARRAASVR